MGDPLRHHEHLCDIPHLAFKGMTWKYLHKSLWHFNEFSILWWELLSIINNMDAIVVLRYNPKANARKRCEQVMKK
jgi:hypothetical protein